MILTDEFLSQAPLAVGCIWFVPDELFVSVKGEQVGLPVVRLKLLYVLMAKAGQVVSYKEACPAVLGYNDRAAQRTLALHVSRLRKVVPGITNIPNVGYRLDPTD